MPLSNLNPFIRYAKEHQHFYVSNQYSKNYDCRLFYIKSGKGSLETTDGEYSFSENTAIYVPPRTKYRLIFQHNDEPWSVLIFNFDLTDQYSHLKDSLGTVDYRMFDLARSPDYPIPEEFSQVIIQKVSNMFEQLQECTTRFLTRTPYYREFASATVKIGLLKLLYAQQDNESLHILKQIKDYIHKNYQKSDLTNEQIAILFGYHPYYLSQLFKEQTGVTMHSYMLSHRIRIAKNYLVTTDLDINTIAWQCGFNSCSYFSKQFRLQTGITPREFRKQKTNHLI